MGEPLMDWADNALPIGIWLGFCAGYLTALIVWEMVWRRQIIKRGLARYHPTTGAWEWKEPLDSPTPPPTNIPLDISGKS